MGTERFYQIATASFEAARTLASLPLGHRERHLHGHSFQVRVALLSTGGGSITLSSDLQRCLAPLDYTLLNTHLTLPSDINLIRWLHRSSAISAGALIGIQSTSDQGVTLDHTERADFWRRFRFEAAHRLPRVAPGHPCGRMHGHGFEVVLHVTQNLQGEESEFDRDLLTSAWQPLHDLFDGSCLNDLADLHNPTSEILAYWIWQYLKPQLPLLSSVVIQETATVGCQYDGSNYHIWKTFRFESSLRLGKNDQRRLYGHSYLLRLHLSAPLDIVMGWTVDYSDVKERFNSIYAQLDHHLLNDLTGLVNTDLHEVTHWIRAQAQPLLPQLNRIDLNETPNCGVILAWGDNNNSLAGFTP